jgi:hypothetical protein
VLESFADCTPPPKDVLHSKTKKQKTTIMQFIYKSRLDVRISKHKPLKNIQYAMIWDRKSTSFIDKSMIIPFTTKVVYFSMNLVWAPLHQAPSAPMYVFSSQPSYLFLGSEWVSDGGRRENWGILRQFSQKDCTYLGQGGDVKMVEFHCSYV